MRFLLLCTSFIPDKQDDKMERFLLERSSLFLSSFSFLPSSFLLSVVLVEVFSFTTSLTMQDEEQPPPYPCPADDDQAPPPYGEGDEAKAPELFAWLAAFGLHQYHDRLTRAGISSLASMGEIVSGTRQLVAMGLAPQHAETLWGEIAKQQAELGNAPANHEPPCRRTSNQAKVPDRRGELFSHFLAQLLAIRSDTYRVDHVGPFVSSHGRELPEILSVIKTATFQVDAVRLCARNLVGKISVIDLYSMLSKCKVSTYQVDIVRHVASDLEPFSGNELAKIVALCSAATYQKDIVDALAPQMKQIRFVDKILGACKTDTYCADMAVTLAPRMAPVSLTDLAAILATVRADTYKEDIVKALVRANAVLPGQRFADLENILERLSPVYLFDVLQRLAPLIDKQDDEAVLAYRQKKEQKSQGLMGASRAPAPREHKIFYSADLILIDDSFPLAPGSCLSVNGLTLQSTSTKLSCTFAGNSLTLSLGSPSTVFLGPMGVRFE